jgi:hypothetical protein
VFTVVCMGWCTTGVREVRTVGHVLLLPGLSIAGQENAGPAVAQEDGYRAVVGLARALARSRQAAVRGRRSNGRPRASCLCIFIHPTTCVASDVTTQRLSDRSLALRGGDLCWIVDANFGEICLPGT